MPQLVIEQPGVAPMTFPLTGGEVHFGRAEDNTVMLVADEVSRHHAKIVQRGAATVLIDLNSLNGTYVNRQRIVERALTHLDEIWFGSKCRLVFRDDTALGRTETSVSRPDSQLAQDISKIRAEMDRVGDNLTMIGRRGQTPQADTSAVATPRPAQDEMLKIGRAYRRLDALFRASKHIASNFDLEQRLSAVLDTAIEVMNADRGFIMLRDEQTGALCVSVAREMGKDLEASSPSMGIAGRAAFDGEPVLYNPGAQDALAARASIIQQRIASAMCVPLKVEDRILGTIYLDSRRAGHEFNEEDLELFLSLASQSAMAIYNTQLYHQMVEAEKKRASLGRFLSPAVVDEILRHDAALELGGRKATVTAMFGDIRGFTTIAERMAPSDLVAMLNEYFTAMTAIIFGNKGTLDKYIGDEIMAVFGAPLSAPDDALRAVRAGMAMQARNAELNVERGARGIPQFEVGIGICTGDVIAGFVGSPERMEFTVVGDRVNTARRLCSLAGPGQVVIAAPTYEYVRAHVEVRPIGTVMLKGKEAPEHAFEVVALKT